MSEPQQVLLHVSIDKKEHRKDGMGEEVGLGRKDGRNKGRVDEWEGGRKGGREKIFTYYFRALVVKRFSCMVLAEP